MREGMSELQHTRTYYEQQLRKLKDKLLIMSCKAEEMISDSIRSFLDRRSSLAEAVITGDDEMDRLEVEIDNVCYELLALEQPVACDLRFIATALKIVKHLERVGDHSTNIAEMVVFLVKGQDIRHGAHAHHA